MRRKPRSPSSASMVLPSMTSFGPSSMALKDSLKLPE
jgi:hypothetical protein